MVLKINIFFYFYICVNRLYIKFATMKIFLKMKFLFFYSWVLEIFFFLFFMKFETKKKLWSLIKRKEANFVCWHGSCLMFFCLFIFLKENHTCVNRVVGTKSSNSINILIDHIRWIDLHLRAWENLIAFVFITIFVIKV